MRKVNLGDFISIHYTGKLEDGNVFDSSKGQDPLEFNAGSEDLIKGMNDAVVGMSIGEKKTVTIKPENAYGEFQPQLVQKVPKNAMPSDIKTGDQLMAQSEQGHYPVWIRQIEADQVTVDANHPLAGKTLIFDIEIVNVQDHKPVQHHHHEHGPGCKH